MPNFAAIFGTLRVLNLVAPGKIRAYATLNN